MQTSTPDQAWLALQRGEKEARREAGGSSGFIVWMVSPSLLLAVLRPSEGWVMWVMESNRVQRASVTVTLLYPVSAGSEVIHSTYWSCPCPTHLGLKWVYPTLIKRACQWAALPNGSDSHLSALLRCPGPPPPQPNATLQPHWPVTSTHTHTNIPMFIIR